MSICLLETLLKSYRRIARKFMEESSVVKKTKQFNNGGNQIALLTAQSEIRPLLNTLWADFGEICRIALQ